MTETTTLSPLYMGVYNYSMGTMLYETLLKYEDGEVKGNLAESYSFNEEGTVMTLKLRQGVTFHDGIPFNSEAVKKNLDFMHSNPQFMACPGIYDIGPPQALNTMQRQSTAESREISFFFMVSSRILSNVYYSA